MKLRGNILVLTQWSFKDALVQTYTLPYVDIIRGIIPSERKIIVVTAEQEHIALKENEIKSVNDAWSKKNMRLLAQPYRRFGVKKIIASFTQLFRLFRIIQREKIKTIHAFCTPAGGIGYLLSRLTGAKLVIDSYEPHAEAMVENGTWNKNGPAFRILFSLEKRLTRRAAVLIGTTAGMKQYAFEKYGTPVNNFFTKPACVDLEKFSLQEKNIRLLKELNLENRMVCVYAGKLGGIYFKEEVFDFIRACYDYWKDDFRFLLLTNATAGETDAEISRVDLPPGTVIRKFVYHQDIPAYLSLGDFAINPVKPVPTKRYCTSIKDGEYWAMGLPVIISPNISDDSEIIERSNTGVVLDFKNSASYRDAIIKIAGLLDKKNELKGKIRETAAAYRSFRVAENVYKEIYV